MWVVDVAFREECKRYPQGTRGTTAPYQNHFSRPATAFTTVVGFNQKGDSVEKCKMTIGLVL